MFNNDESVDYRAQRENHARIKTYHEWNERKILQKSRTILVWR